jgi:hypothetical protein
MRRYDGFLIFLGLAGAVSLILPDLLLLFMFSMVGIPLAIAMYFVPGLALVLILGRITQRRVIDRLVPRFSGQSGLIGVCAVVIMLTLLSAYANARQDAQIARLVAGDLNTMKLPLPTGIYGLRSVRNDTDCDATCQRLLLSGTATEVLVEALEFADQEPNPNLAVPSWRMERRTSCPDLKLPEGEFVIPTADGPKTPDTISTNEVMLAAIASGQCLIEAERRLVEADVIISSMRLIQAPPGDKQGFSLGGDLLTVDRLDVHQNVDGVSALTYRWTGVVADRMWPLAVPTVTSGRSLDMGAGFMRQRAVTNIGSVYYEGPDWEAFLTQTLRLDLTIDTARAEELTRASLDRILIKQTALNLIDFQLIEQYLSRFDFGSSVDPVDHDLFLRIVSDRRVVLTSSALRAMPLPGNVTSEYLKKLSDAAWSRLPDFDPVDLYAQEQEVAGQVLYRMPPDILIAYREEIFNLSENPKLRWHVGPLLSRLSDFGDDGGRQLLWLIKDTRGMRENSYDMFKSTYLPAIMGLCHMGPSAATLKDELLDLANHGLIMVDASTEGDLSLRMLIRIGLPKPIVRRLAARDRGNYSDEQLDLLIRRPVDEKDCQYQ